MISLTKELYNSLIDQTCNIIDSYKKYYTVIEHQIAPYDSVINGGKILEILFVHLDGIKKLEMNIFSNSNSEFEDEYFYISNAVSDIKKPAEDLHNMC